MNINEIRDYVYLTFTGKSYSNINANSDYDSLVSLLANIYSNDGIITAIENNRSIDSASTTGLDVIGKRFGITRNKYSRHMSLTDDNVMVSISSNIDEISLFKDNTKVMVIPKEAIISIIDIYGNTYRPLSNVVISNTTFSGPIYISMNEAYDGTIYPMNINTITIDPLLVSNINLNVYNDSVFKINNSYALVVPSTTMNDTEYRYIINQKIQSLLIKNTDFIYGELNAIANVVNVHKFENLYGLGSTTYYLETTNKDYDAIIEPIALAILEKYSNGNCNICFPIYLNLTIYTTETETEPIKTLIENSLMGEQINLTNWNITSILIDNIQAIESNYLNPAWNEKYIVTEIINV